MTAAVGLRAPGVPAGRSRGPRPFRLPWALAYWVPAAITAIVTYGWFTPGRFIGAGDVSPLVRNSLGAEVGSLWNHQVTGAGATTSDAGRAVEVTLIEAMRPIGLDELAAQRVLYVLVMALAVIGITHLARVLVHHPVAAATAGALALLNPFVLLHLPNLIFPLAIGLTGLLAGELLGHLDGRPTTVTRLAVASLPFAYLSINPPLLIVVVGAVGLAFLGASVGVHRTGGTLRVVALAVPVIAVLHLFWLVPFLIVNASGAEGVIFAAVTDADAWDWVHAQNSLDRVATLTAHWGWPHLEYFPWTDSLDAAPWVILRWYLPLGAVAGAVLADRARRRAAWSLAAGAGGLIIVSQGLHAPFGWFNSLLYDHVPGWWLFRDPISKFGPLLVIVLALLFGLFVDRVIAISAQSGVDRQRSVVLGVLAVVTAGALLHPYPLLTREAIPSTARGALPSAHVAVPDAWSGLAAAVSDSPLPGKVAVLPLNDFYQVTTSWGYHGVDLVPQLFDRPVLQRLPGGYYAEVPAYEGLLEAAETAVLAGDGAAANRLLDALGASHLLIRHDLEPGVSGRRFADDDELLAGGDKIAGLELVQRTDVASLYERPRANVVRAEVATVTADIGTHADAIAGGLGAVIADGQPSDAVLWNDRSDPLIPFASADDQFALRMAGSGELELAFSVKGDTLRADLIGEVLVDDVVLDTAGLLSIDTAGKEVAALHVGSELVPFVDGMTAAVIPDEEVVAYTAGERRPIPMSDPLSDCHNADDRGVEELGFTLFSGADRVVLGATNHSACLSHDLDPSRSALQLSVSMRSLSGAPARLCVWSADHESCAVSDTATDDEAVRRSYLIDTDEWGRDLELFVYADGGSATPTLASYHDIVVRDLDVAGSDSYQSGDQLDSVSLAAGNHELHVSSPSQSVLGHFGALGDCNRVDDRTPADVGLEATVAAGDVELAARDHAACVDAPVNTPPGDSVVVSFGYDVISGSGPRFCLWQEGTDMCAPAPAVDATGSYRAEIPTDATATELSLYLYADGNSDTETRIAFRDVQVSPARNLGLTLEAIDETRPSPPSATLERRATSRYDITVTGASGEFVLVVPESFAPGWELSDLPSGWSAAHIRVDGYANGWRITGTGDATMTVGYGPGELVRAANLASPLALAALGLSAIWRRHRSRCSWRWRVPARSTDRRSAREPVA